MGLDRNTAASAAALWVCNHLKDEDTLAEVIRMRQKTLTKEYAFNAEVALRYYNGLNDVDKQALIPGPLTRHTVHGVITQLAKKWRELNA